MWNTNTVGEAPIDGTVSIERIRIQHQKYKKLRSANKKRTHTSGIWNRVIWRESLFTNAPLDHRVDIILRRIYHYKEIETPITGCETKETLALCTKNFDFTYIRKVFVQTNSVAIESLLTPVLADIVMTDFEKTLPPDIYILYIKFWRTYIDDAISYVVMLSYLLLGNEVRQENWYNVSCLFNRILFKGKLTHLEKVFFEKNNYPKYVIKLVLTQAEKELKIGIIITIWKIALLSL